MEKASAVQVYRCAFRVEKNEENECPRAYLGALCCQIDTLSKISSILCIDELLHSSGFSTLGDP